MVLLKLLALTSGVVIVLGLVVVGLLDAPWPVLLLLLSLGLFVLQRLASQAMEQDSSLASADSQISAEKEASASSTLLAKEMPTFTYRGVQYQSPSAAKPTIDVPTTITEGIYRGQPWRRSNADASKQTPPLSEQPPPKIKYRGHRVK